MSNLATRQTSRAAKLVRFIPRLVTIIVVTWLWGWVLNKSVASSDERAAPAGFARGMFHGAMMPGAMPSLLMGKDVVIYATNNNGRLYKLGYTFGVNACGALFFGMFFLRLKRWKAEYSAP